MKILIYTDCFFVSGSERFPIELCRVDQNSGKSIIHIGYRYSKQYYSGLKQEGILGNNFHAFKFPDLSFENFFQQPRTRFIAPLKIVALVLRLIAFYPLFLYEVITFRRFLTRNPFDIVHINNGGFPGALSCRAIAVAAKSLNITSVMTVNNLPRKRYLFYYYEWATVRLVLHCVQVFLSSSNFCATALKLYFYGLGSGGASVITLRNGISLSRLRTSKTTEMTTPSGDMLRIGFIGNLELRKGAHVFVDAIHRILLLHSDVFDRFNFSIWGEGPERPAIERQIAGHNLQGKILLEPRRLEISDIMEKIDVLVVPSVSNEDFPNIVLEGMALGKLVIASDFGGISEQIISNETGMLFRTGDSSSLGDIIVRVLRSPCETMRIRANAHSVFMNEFEINTGYSRYVNLMCGLMGSTDK